MSFVEQLLAQLTRLPTAGYNGGFSCSVARSQVDGARLLRVKTGLRWGLHVSAWRVYVRPPGVACSVTDKRDISQEARTCTIITCVTSSMGMTTVHCTECSSVTVVLMDTLSLLLLQV